MIKTALITAGLIFSLFGVSNVWATPALDIKRVEKVSPPPSQNTVRTPTPTISPSKSSKDIQNLQNQVKTIEDQLGRYRENPKVNNWLIWWWQIGFWVGILWLFLWVFVGWQWTHFKFWGFGWPWPWWFWIPLFWFIPWLIIGWQWWLVWWVWWIWIWWLFPWIFWLFWWVIVFKELIISLWHRRKPSSITTE